MRILEPGYVTENILFLGRKESCIYLLDGKTEYVLMGGGMVHVVDDVLDQLEKYNIDEKKITKLIILHSHFDHCGIVSFFKKKWPWVKIAASNRAKQTLSDEKSISMIDFLNSIVLSKKEVKNKLETGFKGIKIDLVLNDNDLMQCGDIQMKILEVPGHSSCSIAVYLPEQKCLFSSDSAGLLIGDKIFTAANSNFDQYMKSLDKLARLDVEIILAEHFGGVSGDDAHDFLQRSIENAKSTRKLFEQYLQKIQNINLCAKELTALFMKDYPEGFLEKEIVQMVIEMMLKYLSKQ